jgi:dynein heavy chain 1, cytosolic
MFRVFARFNLLLTRTRVRAAVKEFQLQLISTVSTAIEKLQSKFTHKYETSAAARISRLRGIPPVAGKILWAKQMERQVNTLMERMGNVLGPNWGQQMEGRQLRKSGDELLAKLDARSFFQGWVVEWEKSMVANSKINSYLVIVEDVAKVNFDDKSEVLSKEIRQLKWLGYGGGIPKTLTAVADEAASRFPYAIAIKTALRSYQAVRVHVTPELEPLVMPQLLDIRECISDAFDVKLSTSTAVAKKRRVKWDNIQEMTDWVNRLADGVTKFEDRVEQLLRACDKVDIALNLLEEVDYDFGKFKSVLASIQKTIDEMSLSGYSDLDAWVDVVSEKMAAVLAKRLEGALMAWNYKFKPVDSDKNEESTEAATATKPDNIPDITITTSVSLEILLRNQEISSVPAIPSARSILIAELNNFVGIVCSLPKPLSGKYEVFDGSGPREASTDSKIATFEHVLAMVPKTIVAQFYQVADFHIHEASKFVVQWLDYQTRKCLFARSVPGLCQCL